MPQTAAVPPLPGLPWADGSVPTRWQPEPAIPARRGRVRAGPQRGAAEKEGERHPTTPPRIPPTRVEQLREIRGSGGRGARGRALRSGRLGLF